MGSNRIRTERVGQRAGVATVQTCVTESADSGYLSSRLSPNPVGAHTSLYRWVLSTITQDICPASVSLNWDCHPLFENSPTRYKGENDQIRFCKVFVLFLKGVTRPKINF